MVGSDVEVLLSALGVLSAAVLARRGVSGHGPKEVAFQNDTSSTIGNRDLLPNFKRWDLVFA